jgi:hypothetical protein
MEETMERRWLSICNAHRDYREDCEQCQVGRWNDEPKPTNITELKAGLKDRKTGIVVDAFPNMNEQNSKIIS